MLIFSRKENEINVESALNKFWDNPIEAVKSARYHNSMIGSLTGPDKLTYLCLGFKSIKNVRGSISISHES